MIGIDVHARPPIFDEIAKEHDPGHDFTAA
jgi:hypothetical protein